MKATDKLRVAIYARVSTKDQKCLSQLSECRAYISRQPTWELTMIYQDKGISGTKHSRPQLDECIADAAQKKFDIIVVYKLDRWGRSLVHLSQSITELGRIGCRFIAITQGIDTDQSNPTSRLLLNILASLAEWEREIIRERTLAGVQAAIDEGKVIGRPARVFRIDLAREMRTQGQSFRAISKELGVPVMTVVDAIQRAEA